MEKATFTHKMRECEMLEMIYEKHFKSLVLYSLSYTHRSDIAEDIVQDVIINFFEKRRAENIQSSIVSYLRGAVIKASIKYNRDNYRLIFDNLEARAAQEALFFIDDEDEAVSVQKLLSSIEALPEKNREIIKMIIFSDKKFNNVAEELSVSIDSVKYQYYKSLTRIKHLLNKTYQFIF